MLDLVAHVVRDMDICRRDRVRLAAALGEIRRRIEARKVESLEVELGLLRGELTRLPPGR